MADKEVAQNVVENEKYPVDAASDNEGVTWTEAEEALAKRFAAKSLEGMSPSASGLNSDIHADADYRAHLIGVMARRAVQKAADR